MPCLINWQQYRALTLQDKTFYVFGLNLLGVYRLFFSLGKHDWLIGCNWHCTSFNFRRVLIFWSFITTILLMLAGCVSTCWSSEFRQRQRLLSISLLQCSIFCAITLLSQVIVRVRTCLSQSHGVCTCPE